MKHMKSKVFVLFTAVMVASILLTASMPASASPMVHAAKAGISTDSQLLGTMNSETLIDQLDFQQAVRKLWEDHISWTRFYIISALADLPETDAAAQRLLQNQTDIGNAIKPFYGEDVGNQLTALLTDHILIAVDLLAAAKAGDDDAFQAAYILWHENADQIAAFLNAANPDNWPFDEMQAMMYSHLALTLDEAVARLNADWAGDVAAYDEIHNQILGMADMLAMGIIMQFPDQFTPQDASQQEIDLTLAMDKLWTDHVLWTRLYIISVTSGLPDADAAAQRLLQNQADIGNAIKPFYGEKSGNKLTALLTKHILIAVDLLNEAKAGDNAGFEKALARWYKNADKIAKFLNKLNPDNWPKAEMRAMMREHLDLTLLEATARLQGDWAADVAAYDQIHTQILEMAGMLTAGIVAQFPELFE
jgi:hypothetical protein